MPQVHGLENPTATPEGDIYAFALTIYEVCDKYCGFRPLIYTIQVLTGKTPFPGVLPAQLVFFVPGGLRPNKPANASAIGFSDSLWSFTERCWGHEKNSRPEVAEIVIHLAEAVASWHGLMPPCKPAEDVEIGSPDEPTAALAEFGEFENLLSPPLLLIEQLCGYRRSFRSSGRRSGEFHRIHTRLLTVRP